MRARRPARSDSGGLLRARAAPRAPSPPPEQVPEQVPEQAPEQVPEQAPEPRPAERTDSGQISRPSRHGRCDRLLCDRPQDRDGPPPRPREVGEHRPGDRGGCKMDSEVRQLGRCAANRYREE